MISTALLSTGLGLIILAASQQPPAVYVGLLVPGGLWLTSVSPRERSGWLIRPLSRLYDSMGEDMQAWCDVRRQAAAMRPQWISDAVQYYAGQVENRIKDERAQMELSRWRESIVHKISIVRLIDLDTTAARLRDSLQKDVSTRNIRKYSDDDLPRLALRLETEALNELHLYLACVYRLGYHKLLIYPFRPSIRRVPASSYQPAGASGSMPEVRPPVRPSVYAVEEAAEGEDYKEAEGPGGGGIGNGGNGPANGDGKGDEAPRERRAWPRLSCPDAVVAGTVFDLYVGLAGDEDTSVYGTGRLRVPTSECELLIELQANGFVIERGTRRFTLRVTPNDPFPVRALRLKPTEDPGFRERRIAALFTVGGELHGYAARDVTVVATRDEVAAARERNRKDADDKLARQPNVLSSGGSVADLTITIIKDARQPTALIWSAVSPHVEMPFTLEPPRSDLGDPVTFLREVVRKASEAFSVEHGFQTLHGMGLTIAGQIPGEIQDAIRQVAGHCRPAPPTILLATQDPYIPWELAVLDPPIGAAGGRSPFLGSQAAIGRWPLPKPPPPPRRPPQSVAVKDQAVITGSYMGVMGATQLPDAEEEAKCLLEAWPGAKKIPASFREVMDCLRGDPPADVLHFALHGKFDETGRQEGIFLIGKQSGEGVPARVEILSPFDVRASSMSGRAPLVFLNACQIGASREVLGDYAGMAEAFLHAGASAVIAPLWSIDDGAAKTLALSFYRSASGADAKPPAEILREERARLDRNSVRDDSPPPLICLSYQFFGHPRFRLMHAVYKEV
jgi:hypothetical protein